MKKSEKLWKEVEQLQSQLDKFEGTHSQHPSVMIGPAIKVTKLMSLLCQISQESAHSIIRLTWGLHVLTIGLFILTIALLAVEVRHMFFQQGAGARTHGVQFGEQGHKSGTNLE